MYLGKEVQGKCYLPLICLQLMKIFLETYCIKSAKTGTEQTDSSNLLYPPALYSGLINEMPSQTARKTAAYETDKLHYTNNRATAPV